jgi:hypothetical protein
MVCSEVVAAGNYLNLISGIDGALAFCVKTYSSRHDEAQLREQESRQWQWPERLALD